MKNLLIGLSILMSIPSFGSDDKLEKIHNIVDSVVTETDNYHCARLKGYIEGLRLEKQFPLNLVDESECRMTLVGVKKIIDTVTLRYPDVAIQTITKGIKITRKNNDFGKCYLYNKAENMIDSYKKYGEVLEFGIRGYTGKEFMTYSLPIINTCIKTLTEKAEDKVTN